MTRGVSGHTPSENLHVRMSFLGGVGFNVVTRQFEKSLISSSLELHDLVLYCTYLEQLLELSLTYIVLTRARNFACLLHPPPPSPFLIELSPPHLPPNLWTRIPRYVGEMHGWTDLFNSQSNDGLFSFIGPKSFPYCAVCTVQCCTVHTTCKVHSCIYPRWGPNQPHCCTVE